MKEESVAKQYASQDTIDNSVPESSCSEFVSATSTLGASSGPLRVTTSQSTSASTEPAPSPCSHLARRDASAHRDRRDSPSRRGERRDSSTGRSRDGRERRRSKEPPSSDYLRALLNLQQRDGSTSVGESPAVMSIAQPRAGSENSSEAGVPITGTEAHRSGNTRNPLPSLAALEAAVAATATVASVPSVAAPAAACDPEAARRRTLFEIQRLMLEARPYDSIEFFHVQRELVKYLGLEPQRRASITDYISSPLPKQDAQQAAEVAAMAGVAAEEGAASSRSSSAPAATSSSSPSGGFWKRLRSRWRRGGAGSSEDFKGDGDVDIFEHRVESRSSSVNDSQTAAKTDSNNSP